LDSLFLLPSRLFIPALKWSVAATIILLFLSGRLMKATASQSASNALHCQHLLSRLQSAQQPYRDDPTPQSVLSFPPWNR
jgi:cation transport ATPase